MVVKVLHAIISFLIIAQTFLEMGKGDGPQGGYGTAIVFIALYLLQTITFFSLAYISCRDFQLTILKSSLFSALLTISIAALSYLLLLFVSYNDFSSTQENIFQVIAIVVISVFALSLQFIKPLFTSNFILPILTHLIALTTFKFHQNPNGLKMTEKNGQHE